MTSSTAARSAPQDLLQQRERRNLVELRGYGVRGHGEIVDLHVLDLSYNGCGIECATRFNAGEEIKLSVLGRGAVKAVVQWSDGRKSGLTFEDEPASRKRSPRKADRTQLSAEAFLRRS